MKFTTTFLLTGVAAFFSGLVLAADAQLLKKCEECHASDGNGKEAHTPSIAGMHPDNFVESIAAFKDGSRPLLNEDAKKMKEAADKLSEADIKALSDFYSKQAFKARDQKVDDAKAKAGEKIHKEYCGKCHENGGRANTDGVSILAGQPMEYLMSSMKTYAEGKRSMGKNMEKKFQAMQKKEGDKALEALAHYYASEK